MMASLINTPDYYKRLRTGFTPIHSTKLWDVKDPRSSPLLIHTHTNNNLHSNATVEALNVNTEVTSK